MIGESIPRRRSEVPQMPLLLLLLLLMVVLMLMGHGSRGGHLVVLQRGDGGGVRHERIGSGGRAAGEEVVRDGSASEELIFSGVRNAGSRPTAGRAETLHALEVKTILLEMTSDVLARQPIDAHQLHYSLRDSVLDPQMSNSVNESFVQLRSPHKPRPLQGARRLVAAISSGGASAAGEIGGFEVGLVRGRGRVVGRRVWVVMRGWDVKGEGEVGGDEGLR